MLRTATARQSLMRCNLPKAFPALLVLFLLAGCTTPPEQWLIPTPTPVSVPEPATAQELPPPSQSEPSQSEPSQPEASQPEPVPTGQTARDVEQRDLPSPPAAQSETVPPPGPSATVWSPDPDEFMPVDTALGAAITFVPGDSSYLEFTNWTYLKEVAGVPDLNSNSPMDAREAFMLDLGINSQALAAGYGRFHFRTHAEDWGWDSTDLLWEATFPVSSGAPHYVLKFRPDFDFSPVLERFATRDFAETTVNTLAGPVRLFTHPLDFDADWLNTTEFAILNTAFLPQANVFVMGGTADSVSAIVDDHYTDPTLRTTMVSRPDMLATVKELAGESGAVGAAVLLPTGCQPLDIARYLLDLDDTELDADLPNADALMDELRAPLEDLRDDEISGVYSVMGAAYRQQEIAGEITPVGVYIYHYPVAEQAQGDLDARRELATTGISLVRDAPYAEIFTVRDAFVREREGGANLVLIVEALVHTPSLFFEMLYQRDDIFSVCGP